MGTTVDFQGTTKWIEFHNTGDSDVDLSQYWVCIEPNYIQVGSLNILSGDVTIPAGGFLVVEWSALGTTQGELGLFREGPFGNSDNILDYMQYGADGNGRDDVADEAGIWVENEFIPTVATDETYSFFEEDASTSPVENWWPGIPTPGEANREE